MRSKNKPSPGPSDREIVISRVYDAPRELVFAAFIDPRHIGHWWGPRGFTITTQEMEVRPGGVWKFVMHGPDGTNYDNKIVYREIVKPARLVYAHSGASEDEPGRFVTTVLLEEQEGKTRLTMRAVFRSAAERDAVVKNHHAIEGGKQTLERLAEQLARTPVTIERTFPAPRELVWKALTDPARMKQWYFDGLESFRPEVGFETRFMVRKDGKDYIHKWKVTDVVTGERLSYRWTFEGFPGESFVTFELQAEDAGTRLILTHTGLETFDAARHPDLARANFAEGWTQIIGSSLKEFMEKNASSSDRSFVISRVFDAPRELVWKAWTDPEHLKRWFGPKGFTLPACSLDLRPGGVFHYCMKSPDGREMWGKWIFREIVPPEKLVVIASFSDANGGVTRHPMSATWPLEMLSTTTLTEHAGRTTLTIRWAAHAATEAENQTFDSSHETMTQGWTGTLDQLAAYLAQA